MRSRFLEKNPKKWNLEKSTRCEETCACIAGLAVGPCVMAGQVLGGQGWSDNSQIFVFEECEGSHIACITGEEGCLKLVSLSVCARSVGFYGRLDTA